VTLSSPDLPPITRRLGIAARMRALAACVPPGTRVFADVGTDHGILPIAVLRQQRAQRCIAIDRSVAALAETRRRLRRGGCAERIELRAGDGLAPIAPDEIDVVCIAGLGPRTMASILEAGLPRLRGARVRLVLNPFGGSDAPRAFLAAHGFALITDTTVAERGRSYTILVAERHG